MIPSPLRSERGLTGEVMNSLRVGGLTPLSTVDWPGELSAVVFCQGCPWRCRYCHNPDLLPASNDALIEWQSVLDFLERRRGLLDAVVFSGGEPTLQKTLPDALDQVSHMGFKVALHTGGCYPQRLQHVLPLLDWVALDIKALPGEYPTVTQTPGSGEPAWRSLEMILSSSIDYEVRTTRPPGTTDQWMLDLAARLEHLGVQRYTLQTCRTHRMLDMTIGQHVDLPTTEGLARRLGSSFSEFRQRE